MVGFANLIRKEVSKVFGKAVGEGTCGQNWLGGNMEKSNDICELSYIIIGILFISGIFTMEGW